MAIVANPQRPFVVLIAVLALALVVACGSSAGPESVPGQLSGTITVFAAASLAEAFAEMAGAFERGNGGTKVVFNFAGSPTLRLQLEQGARADVFASADLLQIERARDSGLVGDVTVFVRNSLVVIMPGDNPGKVSSLADLQRRGLRLVVAQENVPVGAYTRQMLAEMERNGTFGPRFAEAVLRNVVSLESNVKQVVAKVELGEVDAGVVYGSDVTAAVAPKLKMLDVPARFNPIAEYGIALTRNAANARAAKAFVDFVLSPAGQAILREHGFQSVESVARRGVFPKRGPLRCA